jgi:hypothetical protein
MRYSTVLAALAWGVLCGAMGCTLTADDFEPTVVAARDEDTTSEPEPARPPRAAPSAAREPEAAAPSGCNGVSEIAGCTGTLAPPVSAPEDSRSPGPDPEAVVPEDAAPEDGDSDVVAPAGEPSCGGGAQSGGASTLDCGASCAPACATGQRCANDGDCASQVCRASSCEPGVALCCQAASCNDGVRNGGEAGVDCGDASCGPCPLGQTCSADVHCQSGFCRSGACSTPTCDDGARGGSESDIDCGGSCPACAPSAICAADADCQSGACEQGRCCGDRLGDCTRCARRLVPTISCELISDPGIVAACNAFLDCLANNPGVCSVRLAPGCSDAGGVCDHTRFGGNGGAAIVLADAILGTAQCLF